MLPAAQSGREFSGHGPAEPEFWRKSCPSCAARPLPGFGRWTQQERPDEVNGAMIEFLLGL
jgi:pimeloyl-ACP methyl ester carboxylesterase